MADMINTQLLNSAYANQQANNQLYNEYYNQTQNFNSAEAQKNRDFQLYMSNTSYQRAVDDLKKAGLNPILAVQNGGASTGSGATASSGSGQVDTSLGSLFASLLPALVNSATSMANAQLESSTSLANSELMNKTNSEIARLNAQSAQQVARTYTDTNKYIAQNYPSTMWSSLASILGGYNNSGVTAPQYNAEHKGKDGNVENVIKNILRAIGGLPQVEYR